ncbi:ATP-dependent helicase [Candidatus Saccharibacteria bacterium]|nr:ATP-dependent helicase [Candidatus Saccharibacteria bacterium]
MSEVKLNQAQAEAVDYIYGPLLVLAGPGTGKTQLLSARVANILQQTDTDARNILCLTFTESGASNMRQRLRSLIGDAAYNVTISTYHSFGSDIIKNYAEHFQSIAVERSDDIRMERPIDELSQIQIVEKIVAKLPFDSLLLGARYYVKSLVDTISDLKQYMITPDDLRALANSNLTQIEAAQDIIDSAVNAKGGMSRKKAELFGQYAELRDGLSELSGSLVELAASELDQAYQQAEAANSSKPLTSWKNDWLHKDDQDDFCLTERLRSQKMLELANIYQDYQEALKQSASYDFDDMILRAIEGLKSNPELRYNLQERYQFILLDEFQDTNPSQFDLVKRIADHPVHEGRPNIMAVGDDDQAIFAFQGAHVGNMKDFFETFVDVKVINLTENYRSHADILHVAHNISEQIEDRLHRQFADISKVLEARAEGLPKTAQVGRHEFAASASEYAWVANQIDSLIKQGTRPDQIAVLAPKHKILEGMVPFLKQREVPITYDKRENILQTEIVSGLRLAAQLVQALINQDATLVNHYMPLVLSLPYWQIPARDICQVNWQYAKRKEVSSWPEIAAENPVLESAIMFYQVLSTYAVSAPLELTLDQLAGTSPVVIDGQEHFAPLKAYYFSSQERSLDALKYYESIAHLSVIRAKLREHQVSTDKLLNLQDFLDFFDMYEAAEASLTNTHPIAQAANSVQLMTVYSAKGLEFEHVFILQAHDDVWGSASQSNNKLALPPNLKQIRYSGSSDDERRRLFFVAITRAKQGLYITSHATKDNGKATSPLKYLAEADGVSSYLPASAQQIQTTEVSADQLAVDIETLWQAGQVHLPADFKSLLADRLKKYQMSPTHLNSFINLEYSGPEAFLVQTLLRFPQAPSASGEFGTAIHNTLEWYANQVAAKQSPSQQQVADHYQRELNRRYLSQADKQRALGKGQAALKKYLSARHDMFKKSAKAEVNFYAEGVHLGEAHLSGKIDRLEVDEANKTVRIADFKTGKPLKKWGTDIKSITYKQQLYMYKLLIEGSASWRGYRVESARLEFVEPAGNADGNILQALELAFDPKEEAQIKQLIQAVWQKIVNLDLPDISGYDQSATGSQKFIHDLLA